MGSGLDFGTTNSSFALDDGNSVSLASFTLAEQETYSFRSALYVSKDDSDRTRVLAGPQALEAYWEEKGEGRLIKSVKNFLADPTITSPVVCGKSFSIEDLVAAILDPLLHSARKLFGELPKPFVVGRPVKFVGQQTAEDEQLALARLGKALERVNICDYFLEAEPMAAAYTYEQRLTSDEQVLIVDVGGGTTDFCLANVGPSFRKVSSQDRILAFAGIGVAGDEFDGGIVDNLLNPLFGKGSTYENHRGEIMNVPNWFFSRFARLTSLPTLKRPENLRAIRDVSREKGAHPGLLDLYTILVEDRGFEIFDHASDVKIGLSSHDSYPFSYSFDGRRIEATAYQEDFKQWLSPTLESLRKTLTAMLAEVSINSRQIDRVFLTGGSSLVPALRAMFSEMFGAEKITGGEEFTSIATGLALRSRNPTN